MSTRREEEERRQSSIIYTNKKLVVQRTCKWAIWQQNGTHSTDSWKRFWRAVWYMCLDNSIRFKGGDSWPLENSWLKILPCQKISNTSIDMPKNTKYHFSKAFLLKDTIYLFIRPCETKTNRTFNPREKMWRKIFKII